MEIYVGKIDNNILTAARQQIPQAIMVTKVRVAKEQSNDLVIAQRVLDTISVYDGETKFNDSTVVGVVYADDETVLLKKKDLLMLLSAISGTSIERIISKFRDTVSSYRYNNPTIDGYVELLKSEIEVTTFIMDCDTLSIRDKVVEEVKKAENEL